MSDSFTIHAGNSRVLAYTLESDDVDLTLEDAVIRWWASRARDDAEPDVVLQKTTDDYGGVEIVDEAQRLFEVELTPADTEKLTGAYVFEVEVRLGDEVYTVSQGMMFVEPRLIREAP